MIINKQNYKYPYLTLIEPPPLKLYFKKRDIVSFTHSINLCNPYRSTFSQNAVLSCQLDYNVGYLWTSKCFKRIIFSSVIIKLNLGGKVLA